jgi:hypothetical protein
MSLSKSNKQAPGQQRTPFKAPALLAMVERRTREVILSEILNDVLY